MKKIMCTAVCIILALTALAGCGSKSEKATGDRVLYNINLEKYVKLGDYKKIPVDTSSDTFAEFYKEMITSDVKSKNLYVKKSEGTVVDGDTVNIDYTGKKDGVAFEGGTDTGYDLTIGSNSFIEGFEAGLIGKTIGDTVDLNLTFPEGYQSAELAGQPVVFTVKINYATTTEEMKPEDYYKEFDFATLDEYEKDVTKRSVKQYLIDTVKKNSKINEYPESDTDTIYNAYKNMISKNIQSNYNMDFETYLQNVNQTEADFKTDIVKNQIKPMMEEQLVLYSILDKENLELKDKDITAKVEETVSSYNNANVTSSVLNDYYGDYYFESLTVNEKVADFLYDNAVIK